MIPRVFSASFALSVFLAANAGSAPSVMLEHKDGGAALHPSIQSALDSAGPGDTVRLVPGIYHENIVFKKSGLIGAPVSLVGAGVSTILDGADPSLQRVNASDTRWTPFKDETLGLDCYRISLPIAGITLPGVNTWVSRSGEVGNYGCDRLVATYASLHGLKTNPRGEGIFRDVSHVYIRLMAGQNPNTIGLSIGRAPAVIDLAGQSHLRLRSFEIRNGGAYGINLTSNSVCEDIGLHDLTIRNCWKGISSESTVGVVRRLLISRVRVLNGIPDTWEWNGGYIHEIGTYAKARFDGPWQGVGMRLENLEDSEIRECLILGQWDGMGIRKNRVRIHHNTIGGIIDDGIELESPWSAEIEFFNNYIYDAWTGISVTSNSPGPIHIYRNVVETTRCQTAMNPKTKNNGFGIKSGNDWAGKAENIKFYHNTFYSNSYNLWEKTNDAAPDAWSGYDFVNNVFFSHSPKANVVFRGASRDSDGGVNHWEGNLYNIDIHLSEEAAVTDKQLESHFVSAHAKPGYESIPGNQRNLRLRAGTVGKNTASNYPAQADWPDSIVAWPDGRDRGAWEDGMADDAIGAPLELLRQALRTGSEQ